MNGRQFHIFLAAGSLLLFLLGWGFWHRLTNFAVDLQHQTAERLAALAVGAVEEADRAHDDLTIQSTLRQLAQLPGVVRVEVLDSQGAVRMGGDMTRSGRRETTVNRPPDRLIRVRRSLVHTPGTFVLEISTTRMRHRLNKLQWQSVMGFLIASLWMAAAGVLYWRRDGHLRHEIDTALLAAQATSGESANLQKELTHLQQQSALCLEAALFHYSSPVLILDQRLRVAGCSAKAAEVLSVPTAALRGKFWYELPFLSEHGSLLEQALQSPGALPASLTAGLPLRLQSAGVQGSPLRAIVIQWS